MRVFNLTICSAYSLRYMLVLLFSVSGASSLAQSSSTPSTKTAKVYFIEPTDGAKVAQAFTIKFGLSGMGVAPAGVMKSNTGHHHLLIDADVLPSLSAPLPTNEKVKHFGGGQTETKLTLPPGKHTLQLLLGDQLHTPHYPAVISKKITVTVIAD